jgi:hypothetical protein
VLAGVIGAGILAGVFFVGRPLWLEHRRGQVDPETVLAQSLQAMNQAASYRYTLQSAFTLSGQKRSVSDISGEYAEGRVHIQGNMVNTPVNIYCVDGVLYHYDAQAEKWILIENGFEETASLLISELDPLSYLHYQSLPEIAAVGFIESEGRDCLQLGFEPDMTQPALQDMWQDFQSVILIDYDDCIVTQLELTALNRNNPDTVLSIRLNFADIDHPLTINPPDITGRTPDKAL